MRASEIIASLLYSHRARPRVHRQTDLKWQAATEVEVRALSLPPHTHPPPTHSPRSPEYHFAKAKETPVTWESEPQPRGRQIPAPCHSACCGLSSGSRLNHSSTLPRCFQNRLRIPGLTHSQCSPFRTAQSHSCWQGVKGPLPSAPPAPPPSSSSSTGRCSPL